MTTIIHTSSRVTWRAISWPSTMMIGVSPPRPNVVKQSTRNSCLNFRRTRRRDETPIHVRFVNASRGDEGEKRKIRQKKEKWRNDREDRKPIAQNSERRKVSKT
mmetsp:Transcript_34470/g.83147  ORF Transcript_34470/g.83147 Transcript_34470/m.83147 type:complete len:104 (+) Transcript_34470:1364-1675(+)